MPQKRIPKIVLTGGPCAGKTTGFLYLEEKLSDRGFFVLKAQEMATFIDSCGIKLGKLARSDPEQYFKAQELLARLIMLFEDNLEKFAQEIPDEKKVLLCDRGVMDAAGYIPKENFASMLADLRLTLVQARDARYDGVIHLTTAAIGAEECYSLKDNQARHETPAQARIIDERVKNAWVGHPHLRVIDNSTTFKMKMRRLLQAVSRILGIPVPLEIERKFLISKSLSLRDVPVLYQEISIEQIYLLSPGDTEVRIRKRGRDGSFVYYLTHKQPQRKFGVRIEREEQISAGEYLTLQESRDFSKKIIRKKRFCFLWDNQYFELDVFQKPCRLKLLEIELTEENSKFSLPSFLPVLKEVTDDIAYSNYQIASQNP